MELVLIVTFAGLIGAAVRYMIPGRDRHGLGLMPSVAVIIGSVTWSAAVWLGLSPDTAWPWLVSLGLATGGVVWLGIWLPAKRDAADDEFFRQLTDTKAPQTTP
jgi:uncharacterized membrane protein YfbV (UPF0208 family)